MPDARACMVLRSAAACSASHPCAHRDDPTPSAPPCHAHHKLQRVVLFPAKFSWEGFPAKSKICWEGRESTNSKLQVKCNLPRARTATFPDWEHDLATPRGRGRIAREKAERCHGRHGGRPGAHQRGQQQPRFVFEYCEHRVRIAVPGHELHASVAAGPFTLRAFLSGGGLAQLQLAGGCKCMHPLRWRLRLRRNAAQQSIPLLL